MPVTHVPGSTTPTDLNNTTAVTILGDPGPDVWRTVARGAATCENLDTDTVTVIWQVKDDTGSTSVVVQKGQTQIGAGLVGACPVPVIIRNAQVLEAKLAAAVAATQPRVHVSYLESTQS